MRRAVFSILVGNSSGVLSRVAGMFSRRGYNIDSLTVGETLNPELSRMTIAVTGEDAGTLEEVYEPFLIKEGFLKRTPRGREVTELAYKHLGRSLYNSQKTLFSD